MACSRADDAELRRVIDGRNTRLRSKPRTELALAMHPVLGVVGVVGIAEYVLSRVEADGVLVSAQDRDRHAADAESRPGDLARIDGITHRLTNVEAVGRSAERWNDDAFPRSNGIQQHERATQSCATPDSVGISAGSSSP
jgi:hypothetical protein